MNMRPQDVHREALRRAGDQDDDGEAPPAVQGRVAVGGEGRAHPEAHKLPGQEARLQICGCLTIFD